MKNRGKARILFLTIMIFLLSFMVLAYSSSENVQESRTYTPSSLTVCKGNKCTLSLYSGVRFTQDKRGVC